MDLIVPTGFLVIVGALVVLMLIWKDSAGSRRVDELWREAADRLGAKFTPTQFVLNRAIEGTYEDMATHVRPYSYSEGEEWHRGTGFLVSSHRVPPSLVLRPQKSFVEDVKFAFSPADVEIGAEEFDASVYTRGERTYLLAVLDHETRELLLDGFKSGRLDQIKDGALVCKRREEVQDPSEIVERVRWLQNLAKRLLDPGDETPKRLAANAASDPSAGLRLANLTTLQREFPGTRTATGASRVALADPAPEIRLAGAAVLRQEGFETFSKLATARDGVDPKIRVEALHHLVKRAPPEAVIPVLDVLLHDATWEVCGEAVAACVTLQHAGAVPALLARLDRDGAPEAAVVAAALGDLGDSRAEPALLTILRSPDLDVAAAATEALGRVGSVAAVQPILDRIAGMPLRLKAEARAAIEAIQVRLTGADSGQLALSDAAHPSGTLALADESKGGQVSLSADEERGAGRERPRIAEIEP